MDRKPTYEEMEKRVKALEGIIDVLTEEQKQSRKEKEMLDIILDVAVEGYWSLEFPNKDLYLSPKYYEMLGYNPNEFPPSVQEWTNLIHPDDKEKALEEVGGGRPWEQQGPYESTFRMKTKSGKWRWIYAKSMINRYDQDGKIKQLVGFNLDITERKRAEEALRGSEERYRLLVDNSTNSIFLNDTDGKILFVNIAGAKPLGGMPEDFIGKSMSEILPDTANIYMKKHLQVIETGKVTDFEQMVELPLGRMWFLTNLQPVRDTNGDIIAVQSISYNITESKRADEEMQRLRSLLKNIVDSMPSVLVTVGQDENVTQWNVEAEKVTGIKAHEALGVHSTITLHF